jgi:redox-sensitive bicupin YhaK (pirin superfamily)
VAGVNEREQPGRERSVEAVVRAPAPHWVGDGFLVHGYFPHLAMAQRRLDPFLLLDYHAEYEYGPTDRPRGVGVHPHRGFETVTLAFQGAVAHHDSTGAGGVIRKGDVQWMTAASGILHKEYHEAQWASRGGAFQMAQVWINLPAAHKMDPPGYQPLSAADIPVVELADGAGSVRVVAGEFGGVRGPARTFSPVAMYHAYVAVAAEIAFDVSATSNTAVLVMAGRVRIGSASAASNDFVVLANDGTRVRIRAEDSAELLVLTGEPIGEPIASYGPFVMNTEDEIRQAADDFTRGRFGYLAD